MEWAQFIVIGFTFWFMVPSFIIFCILLFCAAEENPGLAVIVTVIYLALIQICSNVNIIEWISLNTWTFIKYVILYVIIGVVFSVAKFWFYLMEKRRMFDMKFREFLDKRGILDKGYTFKNLPGEYTSDCYMEMRNYELPDIYQSTRHITFWMGYWPIVGLWTLINNPLKWLWEELKHQLSQLFQSTHKKILGDRVDTVESWQKTYLENQRKSFDKPKDSDWK